MVSLHVISLNQLMVSLHAISLNQLMVSLHAISSVEFKSGTDRIHGDKKLSSTKLCIKGVRLKNRGPKLGP